MGIRKATKESQPNGGRNSYIIAVGFFAKRCLIKKGCDRGKVGTPLIAINEECSQNLGGIPNGRKDGDD